MLHTPEQDKNGWMENSEVTSPDNHFEKNYFTLKYRAGNIKPIQIDIAM